MGGLSAGRIEPTEHEAVLWEKRIDAMLMLLSDAKRRIMRTDELRRGIEALPEDAYHTMSYYERWIASITAILLEKGVLTKDEIERRIAEVQAREEPLL